MFNTIIEEYKYNIHKHHVQIDNLTKFIIYYYYILLLQI